MGRVALVGLVPSVAEVVVAALADEGHAVEQYSLDADGIRRLGRDRPNVVLFDGHAYANTKAFLSDLRRHADTKNLPVVLVGPERPAEVPNFEVVHQLGRAFDLNAVLSAVRRALGQLGD